MAGDIYFNDVGLLLHCDGSNGSTSFIDYSNNGFTVSANGDVQVSTTESKFGGASAFFDGITDYLATSINTINYTSDLTIECFFNVTTFNNTRTLIGTRYSNTHGFAIRVQTNGFIRFYGYAGSSTIVVDFTSSTAISIETWYHIAIVKSGTTWTMYIDGSSVGSDTQSANIVDYSQQYLTIGCYLAPAVSESFYGYVDEVRITNGIARYTSNFTPTSTAFSNYTGTVSGSISETLSAVDFIAQATRLSDSELSGRSIVNGTSYSLEVNTLEPVLVTMLPDYGTQWTTSTAYALTDKVFPTDPTTSPYYYECTTAGTSDASEPTWPTSGTVNDNTVVWTYVEQMVQPITHGPLIPS